MSFTRRRNVEDVRSTSWVEHVRLLQETRERLAIPQYQAKRNPLDGETAPAAIARAAEEGLSGLSAALAYVSKGTWSAGAAPGITVTVHQTCRRLYQSVFYSRPQAIYGRHAKGRYGLLRFARNDK